MYQKPWRNNNYKKRACEKSSPCVSDAARSILCLVQVFSKKRDLKTTKLIKHVEKRNPFGVMVINDKYLLRHVASMSPAIERSTLATFPKFRVVDANVFAAKKMLPTSKQA